jgi:phosphatidylglycerophosphate synthase
MLDQVSLQKMNWFRAVTRSLEELRRILVAFIRKVRWPVTSAICRVLIRLHINQTHLTLSRIFFLIVFYFAWVYSFFTAALILMLAAWALDCLDGDLSRMLGQDSSIGEFEDIMGDNLACLVFPLALMQTGLLNGVIGGLFIFASFSNLWLINRNQPNDSGGVRLAFEPRSSMFISIPAISIWALMFVYIFFKFNVFDTGFLVVAILLCLSVAVNYYQIIKSRL